MSVNPDVLKQYGTAEALATRRGLYQCIVGPSLTETLNEDLALDNHLSFLDVGCGYGADIHHFQQRYPQLQAIGIDTSAGQLEDARSKNPQATFVVADASSFQFEEKFDRVLVRHVLHLLDDPQRAIENTVSHVKPGGRAVFVLHSLRSQPHYTTWLKWFADNTGIGYISPSDAFTIDNDLEVFKQFSNHTRNHDVTQMLRLDTADPYLNYIKSQKRWSRPPTDGELEMLLKHVRAEIENDIQRQGYFEDASVNGIVVIET